MVERVPSARWLVPLNLRAERDLLGLANRDRRGAAVSEVSCCSLFIRGRKSAASCISSSPVSEKSSRAVRLLTLVLSLFLPQ